MALIPTSAHRTAVVTTAVFLYLETPAPNLETQLACIESSPQWELLRYRLTTTRAEAFRCIKAPALLVYDTTGNETTRAIGDLNITKFIDVFRDDMV